MVTHIGTQTIETERLLLRRFEYSDIDSMLCNWIANEQTQWDYGEPSYATPEAVKELFDTKYIVSYSREDYYRWAVIEKESQECIGQIAYFSVDTDNQHGEIEYVIGPAFQGKGYATEMTRAVISFGFEKINFNRIEIDCRTENEASRRVIEKCGLTYEGVFRDFFWRKDHFEGRRVFSILKSEWNAVIKTERLLLRKYTPDDFEALYEIMSDPETMQHYPAPFDEDRTKKWITWNLDNYEKYGFGLWAVVLKETGGFIGDCGITIQNIDGEMLPEIGYHIHKKYWRRGFAKEAARAVRDWAFQNTPYDAIYSYMKYTNVGSYSTAIANGMKKIKEYDDSKNTISYAYAITRSEWEAITKEQSAL